MNALAWPVLLQIAALLLLLVVLGDAGMAILSRLRRYAYERDAYARSLEVFEERLAEARIRRTVRSGESISWNGFRKFQVARREDEGGGICSFYLEPHDAKPIPAYRPGQYLTFSLRIPGESRPVVRCYSLSDAPDAAGYRVTIKRVLPPRDSPDAPPGKASSFFHNSAAVGDILDVKAPAGDFSLDLTKSTPIVLIGGGVGVTPVLSMLNAVAQHGFGREVYWFYGVTNAQEHIQKAHLQSLALGESDKLQIHVCYSRPESEATPDHPAIHFHEGYVGVDLFKRVLPSNNYEYYICGPPPMMESVTHDLREWGVPDDKVFFESFGSATVKKTPRAEAVAAGASDAIRVSFARSGVELHWDPDAGSLLEFAERNDVIIDSGCRTGNCGSCVTAIKSGEIDYLVEPGQKPDAGSCLTCVSVPRGDLVLDA